MPDLDPEPQPEPRAAQPGPPADGQPAPPAGTPLRPAGDPASPGGEPPAGPTASAGAAHAQESPAAGDRFAHRPPGYPSALVWLRAGIVRDWRGVLGAFLATWFYVPLALVAAVWGGLALGLYGLVAGGTQSDEAVPALLRDAPLVGPLLDAFVTRSGGVVGGFAGFALGALVGFLAILVLPWRNAFDEPANLFTGLAGMVVAAGLVGLLYTVGRVLLEPWLLGVSGARQLSRREAERLRPLLSDCAARLGLPGEPRLLIEDDPVLTNARAYARHVVVSTAVLDRTDEEIAALLSHELVHWRTGDEVTSAFIRGVGLPLVLVHAVPAWLMRRFPHPATDFVVFLFFWPVLLTMRYLVLPCHRRDVRAAEYRADAGAVLAGHREGMRSMLERRRSFETGRSGWDEAVCATHPPSELRLDRLDRPVPDPTADRAATARGLDELFGGTTTTVGSRRALLVVGALVLVSCLGGGLTTAQWAFFRPQAAVGDYFAALADHDGPEALERLTPDVRAALGDSGQLARMVAAKDYRPPTDVSVTGVERDGDEAVATVGYTLGGQKLTAELPLRRDEQAVLGLFHRWHIDAAPATLTLPGGPAPLTVNGVPAPTGAEGVAVPLLPGAYTVAGENNALSETASRVVYVVPGQQSVSGAELTPTLRPEAQAAAEQSVRSYLDGCAAQAVAAPQGCPFRYYTGGSTVKKIAWKITRYPTIELTLTGPTTARVSTSYEAQGSAQATGSTVGYFGTTPFTENETFGVSGVLSVVDGTLTFQPGDD
ncbi:M48 family metalloprotease [Micromonospora sp. HUAS LYJ1]|uniref:M48 family metalloprotease n=1 Tax=Micromonospora sp. HUAS LYJ1 TaxID=3061626 RepID=UPI0026726B9B|nr:M48 family metalloprotease [Micromonospora sp. HUAS LYJ1]WKU07493.1 M48 family metalloprotease [Micromonospora sp. HUAS LYJ1]